MKVPFLNLKAQYDSIKGEINAAIQQVLDSCAFAGGPFVEKFEKEFAAFCGCDYAIGVGNGTDALWLSLLALGIGPGDEVITVPNTFIATAEAISLCGANPAFVDIDDHTYTMNPNKLEDYLKKRLAPSPSPPVPSPSSLAPSSSFLGPSSSPLVPRPSRPRAVVPVHLFGQSADMDPIMEIARAHGLFVVEDACQAHGALYKGRPVGSIGDVGCFSFYPGKNLGAYGEAGAVVTNDKALAEKMKIFRDHGQPKKYYHDLIGWNARMDGIQGAVLSVKLKYLNGWNEMRRSKAQIYDNLLCRMNGIQTPEEAEYAKHIYHLYVIRIKKRDELITSLNNKGISCGIHYPVPIHLQEAYRSLGLKNGGFPIGERCAREFVSLPMFPELTHQQIEHVAEGINHFTHE